MHDFCRYKKTHVNHDPIFRWTLRIYYEDTDAGGIVYYANYLKYFERARTEWLRNVGINQIGMALQYQAMFVVKSTTIDYHLPAQLDDELCITTVVEKLGRASLVFVQQVWRNDQCLVSGRFKVGCVGVQTIRPCAIPSDILRAIQPQALPLRFN